MNCFIEKLFLSTHSNVLYFLYASPWVLRFYRAQFSVFLWHQHVEDGGLESA